MFLLLANARMLTIKWVFSSDRAYAFLSYMDGPTVRPCQYLSQSVCSLHMATCNNDICGRKANGDESIPLTGGGMIIRVANLEYGTSSTEANRVCSPHSH